MAMLSLLLGCLLINGIMANSSGANSQACTDSNMNPTGHGSSPQTAPSPYGITLDKDQYTANGVIEVTLTGSQSFIGFLVMALPADDPKGAPIGSFSAADGNGALYQAACTGGYTHRGAFSSAQPQKDRVVLSWNAPSTVAGNIVFYATFVKDISTYWVRESSDAVWDGVSAKPVASTGSPVVTDPPSISTISPDGCGISKSCYSECQGNKCQYLLTWKKLSNSQVQFELFASLKDNQNYAAIGLSENGRMEKITIMACTIDEQRNTKVEPLYAEGRVPPSAIDASVISAAESSTSSVDGVKSVSCRFTYDNDLAASTTNYKDVNKRWFVSIAKGPYSFSALSKHNDAPQTSPNDVDLLSDQFVDIGGTKARPLIKAHAIIMVLAWVFAASIGLILARYYKPMWSDTKACGQKVWFSYHRALMLTAMFLTIIGFVLILVEKNGKFEVHETLPKKAHPILGLIAIICALLNPLIAAFRCHPGDSKRPIFNWVHWFFGTVAHVFAIVAIFLGMLFDDIVGIPFWTIYVMMAFSLFHVCVEFILEIHQCCMYDKNRDRQEEFQMSNKGDGHVQEPQYAGRGFKCGMLVIYVIIVSIITIVLVATIAAGNFIPDMVA